MCVPFTKKYQSLGRKTFKRAHERTSKRKLQLPESVQGREPGGWELGEGMEESAVFLLRPVATKAGTRDCVWPRLAVLGFF